MLFSRSTSQNRCSALVLVLVWSITPGTAQTASPGLQEARKELFAAHYEKAVELYSSALHEDSSQVEAYYGLVRALLSAKRQEDAYKAADSALHISPQSAATQSAAGLAEYRRAEFAKAETYFRTALRIDSNYPGALAGLASVLSTVSKFKTARDLTEMAYRLSPDDPELQLEHASTLKGKEHIAALEAALRLLAPESEMAQYLTAHVARDLALDGRNLQRLATPYQTTKIKLMNFIEGATKKPVVGLQLRLNGRQKATVLLDSGASGLSLSPAMASKAGLEILGGARTPAKGIGDQAALPSVAYLASELQIGDVRFSNYPISVFKSAANTDYDGIIGPSVFDDFIVVIDFPRMELSLETRPGLQPADSDEPIDSDAPASGFFRVFRIGNHLAIPTVLNDKKSSLFLLDSGSTNNLVDTEVARSATTVHNDSFTTVTGIQGKVKNTSVADKITLVFAGFRQENLDLVAISLDKASDDFGVDLGGVLGMPVLAQLKMTIDYRQGTVRFEHRK